MVQATKRSVAKGKQNGYEFIIQSKDVIEREHFGRFEVIKTKKGIMFKNYTGYHVWTTPYAVGTDGKAHETSLYSWLDELLQMKRAYTGHEDEPLTEGVEYKKGDVLQAMIITTEANLINPMVVFLDRDKATQNASEQIKWMNEMAKKLQETMDAPAPEEDLKADAEFNAKMEAQETINEMLKEEQNNE